MLVPSFCTVLKTSHQPSVLDSALTQECRIGPGVQGGPRPGVQGGRWGRGVPYCKFHPLCIVT